MRKIWKYKVPIADQFSIEMPVGAGLLTVQLQYELPYLWAIVDPEEKRMAEVQFYLFSTGDEISCDCLYREVSELSYVGSFMTLGGTFVRHLFVKQDVLVKQLGDTQ